MSGESAAGPWTDGDATTPPATILDRIPEDDRQRVLALIFQQIFTGSPDLSVAELVRLMHGLPEEERARLIEDALRDNQLERKIREAHLDEDIADRRAARARANFTLRAGWVVVVGSILIAGGGMLIAPTLAWTWVSLAAIGVGGPTAISLVARNSKLSIELGSDQGSPGISGKTHGHASPSDDT